MKGKVNMKVKLADAVALLVALGFSKAANWELSKVQKHIAQVHVKIEKDHKGLAGHEELYAGLVEADGQVEVVGEAAEAAPTEKASKADKKKSKPEKAEKSEKSEKPAKAEKAEKAEKKKSKPETNGEKVERDAYGCKVGSISAKVNKVMSSDWVTEQEVAEQAGVTLDQARGRLYFGAEEGVGLFERRRLIQYRVLKAPSKKTETAKSKG